MKKINYFLLLVLTIVFIAATKIPQTTEKVFKIIPEATTVSWTAYKTTSKIPVSGIFKEVLIESENSGATIYKALDGLKFSLPVNSVFSQSALRDGQIMKFFFGKMLNTSKILGTINLTDNSSGIVQITMNGVTKKLPIKLNISGELVTIEAVMDLNNWEAQAALEALDDACEDLHTGPDGETVTWSDVKINVTSKVKFE